MDDCNDEYGDTATTWDDVQIPLWTIVTMLRLNIGTVYSRSDSSMDDCNSTPFALLQGVRRVQIPLWTIVTAGGIRRLPWASLFRFLYGRL